MPIDPKQVQWDPIDPSAVQWDESPKAAKPSRSDLWKRELQRSAPYGIARGVKDVIDTGAKALASGFDALTGSNEAQRVGDMNAQGKAEFDRVAGDSTSASIGRIAGNIAGTAPLISAAGAGVAAAGLPRLGAAIGSGGFTTGAAPVGALARSADMGVRMAGGALAGGAQAGMVDPSSAGTGAAVGAALPPGVAALGRVGAVGGEMLKKGGAVVSDRVASRVATEKAAEAIGPSGVRQAVGDLQTYFPKGAEGIPVSSAGVTGNLGLARLEQGSRLRVPEKWAEFDTQQSKAVFDNVLKATQSADEIGALKGARQANWQEAWAKADSSFKPKVWNKKMGELGPKIDQALRSPESSNPAVRGLLQAIKDEVIRVGPDFSPAHLQQIRANLNGRANPLSPDAFKSAPRDSAAVKSVIRELDDILNSATGNKWQKVLEGYAKDSEVVHSAAAASKVRGAFVDRETGRILTKTRDANGEVPVITESALTRAMNSARLPDKSLALSQEANHRLEATLDAMRRQAIVQNLKRSATAGGGSDTVANAFAADAARTVAPNRLLELIDGLRRVGTARTDRQLADLLSNPDDLANALNLLSARQGRPPVGNALAPAYRAAPTLAADR